MKIRNILTLAAVAAGAAYFLDQNHGQKRRLMAQRKIMGWGKQIAEYTEQARQDVADWSWGVYSVASGLVNRAKHGLRNGDEAIMEASGSKRKKANLN